MGLGAPRDLGKRGLKKKMAAHKGLTQAESSLLTQARTGKIGLRAFLFLRKVPAVTTPFCECGGEEETVRHLLEGCLVNMDALDLQRREGGPEELFERLRSGYRVKPILRWLMGKLPEFQLALELEGP